MFQECIHVQQQHQARQGSGFYFGPFLSCASARLHDMVTSDVSSWSSVTAHLTGLGLTKSLGCNSCGDSEGSTDLMVLLLPQLFARVWVILSYFFFHINTVECNKKAPFNYSHLRCRKSAWAWSTRLLQTPEARFLQLSAEVIHDTKCG